MEGDAYVFTVDACT